MNNVNLVGRLAKDPVARDRSDTRITELILVTERPVIRDGKVHQIHNAMMSGRKAGMQSMDDSLADLVRKGMVSKEQAARRAQNPDELLRLLASV